MLTLVLAAALLALPARAADRIVVITDSHGVGSFGDGIEAWLRTKDPASLARGQEWAAAVAAKLSALLP